MIKIIDNKKIDLTQDEWDMYDSMVKSYTRPNCKGEEYFKDLFESDEDGNILFLKPPKKFTSFEIYFFFMSVMSHQCLRKTYAEFDAFKTQTIADLNRKVSDLNEVMKELNDLKTTLLAQVSKDQ